MSSQMLRPRSETVEGGAETIKDQYGDLPGGPGVRTPHVHCRATGQGQPHGLAKKEEKKNFKVQVRPWGTSTGCRRKDK